MLLLPKYLCCYLTNEKIVLDVSTLLEKSSYASITIIASKQATFLWCIQRPENN